MAHEAIHPSAIDYTGFLAHIGIPTASVGGHMTDDVTTYGEPEETYCQSDIPYSCLPGMLSKALIVLM